jgi:glyoxylase-like metal-dependent hydrolase (beta-lactamase superfamily II)
VDPGPEDPTHLGAVAAAAAGQGGAGVILLTHSHGDHSAGAAPLAQELGTGSAEPVAVVAPLDGEDHLGLRALATPGHAADHVCLLAEGGVCFSGDLVLGEGSTFVPPDGGSLAAYMASLRRLRELPLSLICPGHGPWITEPATKLDQYIEHREMRERRLLAEFEDGERSKSRLLSAVWDDVPEELRPAAAVVMEAHLEKLAAEGRIGGDLEP